jgi:phosphoribosyl-ATP pyrophosphohydrolase/phosphoribosyl-AMP cyclohydrolase
MAWLTDRRPRLNERLLPVVVQDADDGSVLMLAWANREALSATERTGQAHFWSRSRDRLWHKGETSGNVMPVVALATDCDADAILYLVRPVGPACHEGTRTCFGDTAGPGILPELERLIGSRRGGDRGSYTARLLEGGPRRAAEKVVEEAGEAAIAGVVGDEDELVAESADLLYHLLVLLAARGVSLDSVLGALRHRRSAPPDS